MDTFDAAGGNDAPCRSSITSWDNAGFIQVGSGHHDLLQILYECVDNELINMLKAICSNLPLEHFMIILEFMFSHNDTILSLQ